MSETDSEETIFRSIVDLYTPNLGLVSLILLGAISLAQLGLSLSFWSLLLHWILTRLAPFALFFGSLEAIRSVQRRVEEGWSQWWYSVAVVGMVFSAGYFWFSTKSELASDFSPLFVTSLSLITMPILVGFCISYGLGMTPSAAVAKVFDSLKSFLNER